MQLRRATIDDADALGAFGRSAFVAAFGHLYRPQDLNPFLELVYGDAATRTAIADPVQHIQLAVDNDVIVGFCRLSLTCGWPDHARGASIAEIKQLYVDPLRTGQAIGAALMDWALDASRAHGADEIQLSVWSENHGAQAFYRRYGFEKLADIDFWVNDHRDDEFLFALML